MFAEGVGAKTDTGSPGVYWTVTATVALVVMAEFWLSVAVTWTL